MPTVAGKSLPKGKPGPGTSWQKQPAVFWVKSQLFCTQELATTITKTVIRSGFSCFGSVLEQFLCHGFSNDHQSLSHLEQGSSYAVRCPHNHVFWTSSPILAERFVQREQKSFMVRGFRPMTSWRCLGFWKCKNCRERPGVLHSPSMHTMNFPSKACRCCQPEALLGAAEALEGLWLQTKTLIPLQTTLVFLLSSHAPLFPFAPLGTQNQQSVYWWKWLFQTPHIPPACRWKTKLVLVWIHNKTAGNLFSIKSTRHFHWCE